LNSVACFHGMLILMWIEDLWPHLTVILLSTPINWQWKRWNACLMLYSKPCLFWNILVEALYKCPVLLLFYIKYGSRHPVIFCFQKRIQSKIFQARFRALKVLLLRSFLYKQLSTINFGNSSQKHYVIAFLKVLPKPVWPD
jgi:hypothetical protein